MGEGQTNSNALGSAPFLFLFSDYQTISVAPFARVALILSNWRVQHSKDRLFQIQFATKALADVRSASKRITKQMNKPELRQELRRPIRVPEKVRAAK